MFSKTCFCIFFEFVRASWTMIKIRVFGKYPAFVTHFDRLKVVLCKISWLKKRKNIFKGSSRTVRRIVIPSLTSAEPATTRKKKCHGQGQIHRCDRHDQWWSQMRSQKQLVSNRGETINVMNWKILFQWKLMSKYNLFSLYIFFATFFVIYQTIILLHTIQYIFSYSYYV